MDRNLRHKILKFAGGFKARNLKFYLYGILKFSLKFAAHAFQILKFYGLEFYNFELRKISSINPSLNFKFSSHFICHAQAFTAILAYKVRHKFAINFAQYLPR